MALRILTLSMMLALFVASGSARARPERIVSTNVCTDQLLLLLTERSRIIALSNLSMDPTLSNLTDEAKGIPQNGARAEEIVPLKPDLVLANAWTGAKANRFLAGLGIDVLVVPEAKSFAEVEDVLMLLGRRLGARFKAEQIVSAMRARLNRIDRTAQRGTALIYEPNGYTPSAGTLSDAILTAAGWTNLAPKLGVKNYGVVPLERVVMTPPDLLIFDDHAPSRASRAQALLHHPALKSASGKSKPVWVPSKMWICAGPWTVDAVERLAKFERRS